MSAWSEFTTAQLRLMRKQLAEAIASGTFRVRYADRDVQYRSLAEMRETLGMVDAELDSRDGRTRTRQVAFTTGKGFCGPGFTGGFR